jgi:hypothetical protein
MRFCALFLLLLSCAAAQPAPRSRLTFSGGWSREAGGYYYAHNDTATGLGLSCGHRVLGFMEAEAGMFTALEPSPDIRGAHYSLDPNDRFIWVPFGVRFIAPLYLGRIEFSGGGGGLYERYSISNPNPGFGLVAYSGWGGYFLGSAAVSLDRRRRLWLGATPRLFLANPRYARDRWLQVAAEISWRF